MEDFTDIRFSKVYLDLKNACEKKSIELARIVPEDYPDADIAEALQELPLSYQLYFLRVLKTEVAAEIFSYFEDESKSRLVHSFTEDWGRDLLQELNSDELADVIDDLPVNLQIKVLSQTPPEKRKLINTILNYDDDQVGSIMTVDITTLKSDLTCAQAISKIRSDFNNNETEIVHYFYVIDEKRKLLGSISLEEIVFSNQNKKIEDLYSPVRSIKATDDKEYAANIFSDHDMSSLPVVDSKDHVLGMITADNVIDVIRESATEDMYKLAGINPDAAEDSYVKTSVKQIVWSRIIWLLVLMVSATLSQFIIQEFTEISEKFLEGIKVIVSTSIIVAMIPVISGAAGNAGSQSSTTITRALSLNEITIKDIGRVVFKELKVSALIGIILFAANFARLIIYFSITQDLFEPGWTGDIILITTASSISLFFVIVFAKFLGTIIPVVALKLKKDPAVMSAPILATLSDAISTLFFFGITLLIFIIKYGFPQS
ncbi:magnesium transporter [Mycoplasma sp. Ms02]|uniref:magnesium transporter n=1 Tax=Mycoplasma sp. Ms02 TaxID=353851 RepID=UPI001C8986E4|nr:magnesium transporter [Mycoplasma sp. Ms02]QZE12334.1 magnesium transporter [Mycoplasma sp. Ms02]